MRAVTGSSERVCVFINLGCTPLFFSHVHPLGLSHGRMAVEFRDTIGSVEEEEKPSIYSRWYLLPGLAVSSAPVRALNL